MSKYEPLCNHIKENGKDNFILSFSKIKNIRGVFTMINITENEIKFNDLEEKMWKKKMQEGLDELKEQLRKIDNQLLKDKNNKELEAKDFQKTTIKCKFGDLEFYRCIVDVEKG